MELTNEDLREIVNWGSVCEGFGSGNRQHHLRIDDIVRRISTDHLGCVISEGDGLSNYYILFSYIKADVPDFPLARRVNGLLIYLSSCGPFAILSRAQACVAPSMTHDPLEIEDVLDPKQCEGDLEETTVSVIRSTGYELLTREEVDRPLPDGIEPFEYCSSRRPWDRVFHVLFAQTD